MSPCPRPRTRRKSEATRRAKWVPTGLGRLPGSPKVIRSRDRLPFAILPTGPRSEFSGLASPLPLRSHFRRFPSCRRRRDSGISPAFPRPPTRRKSSVLWWIKSSGEFLASKHFAREQIRRTRVHATISNRRSSAWLNARKSQASDKMNRMIRLLALIALLSSTALMAEPTMPETAAGGVLGEWLTSFNSADAQQMQAFKDKYDRKTTVEENMSAREETG